MNKTYISKTKHTGRGIFAKKKIRKNEMIFLVRGKIIKDDYGPEFHIGARWLTVGNKTWIMPLRSNPWWFINHSCKPNAGLNGRVRVVAMMPIEKDEEITIDYSITEDDPYWKFRCNCKTKECRVIIRSIGFLPERLFKKYSHYIPRYLKWSYVKKNKTLEHVPEY